MDEVQKKIYQKMSPGEKLEVAHRLYWTARELKASGLRTQNPELSEEEIQKKVSEIFLYAGS